MSKRFINTALALIMIVACMLPAQLIFADPIDNVGIQTDSQEAEGINNQAIESSADNDNGGSALTNNESSIDTLNGDAVDSSDDVLDESISDLDDDSDLNLQDAPPIIYPTPLLPGRYIIRPMISHNRVLGTVGESKGNGAFIQLSVSNKSDAQSFDVAYDAAGLYSFTNVGSNRAIAIQGEVCTSETRVWQFNSSNTNTQKWVVSEDQTRPGSFILTSALSTPEQPLVLDIRGAGDYDGNVVWIFRANGTPAQSFVFMPIEPSVNPGSHTVPDGYYIITSQLPSHFVLDISGASEASGATLQLWVNNKTLAQIFYIQKQSDGFYSIRSANSTAALDVQWGSLMATGTVWQYANNNSAAQRWSIIGNNDGSVTFISRLSGMALDVRWGEDRAGALLQQWYPNGTAAQCFTLAQPKQLSGYVMLRPWNLPNERVDIANASRSSGANTLSSGANDSFSQIFEVVAIEPDVYALRSTNSGCYLTGSSGNVYQETGNTGSVSDARNFSPKDSQKWLITLTFGGYTITNVLTGQAMSVISGSGSSHDIRLSTSGNTQSQIFKIWNVTLRLPERTYTFNNYWNLCIDESGGYTTRGTLIQVYSSNGTSAQKWNIRWIWGDYFSLVCPRSSRVVDIKNNVATNGAVVQLWDYNGCEAQLWRLVPSGDGWFFLQSAKGMYLTAAPGIYNECKMTVSNSINGNTQKFRFTETTAFNYSGTFIEVNLSTQRLIYVKNNALVLDSPVVTGRPSMLTPAGTYFIINKASPATLVGPGYATPVQYWMAFTYKGHGFHDAWWQPSFGSERWQITGSHGCVNMPDWAARELYNSCSVGDTVYVHW